ncbi:DNA-binding response regulator [Virgibacillus dokdonensis]|uniref:DNA-binding response regulator, OmpR family, contains REC and winged-helix (WHTH) domain n=2 Tax=Virgibacillus TaxID=84406 RepID=A0A1M5W2L3_9BACI|nr:MULTISPECIES: response regulator transcription factor [Virgibacillus]RFA36041.1 DNA-binding response regulator [Virgibacillus dokdonensis]SHH81742.1 DNA-binding response regulator, OmpR family, contains REC and winged-helix (wHTH) domain [Virgibacillus chiguensis]
MKKIYLIEDDKKIADLLKDYLEKYEYDIQLVQEFDRIVEEFQVFEPHLILLDINLPSYDGFYWCRKIRSISNCPIIFISARDSGMDQVMAIENGGDDYITKPFNFDVVQAKIKGIMRRIYGEYASSTPIDLLEIRDLCLHLTAMEVSLNGHKAILTKNEFILLKAFMENVNHVLSRTFLLEMLWDDEHFVDDNTLSVNITRVRKKLEDIGVHQSIQTVRGAGYKMIDTWSEQ